MKELFLLQVVTKTQSKLHFFKLRLVTPLLNGFRSVAQYKLDSRIDFMKLVHRILTRKSSNYLKKLLKMPTQNKAHRQSYAFERRNTPLEIGYTRIGHCILKPATVIIRCAVISLSFSL